MRELVNWKDQEAEFPNRYQETDLGNGYIQHTAAPGKIRVPGTPQNAHNFNTMDLAAFEAMLMSAENERHIRMMNDKLDGLVGEKIQVTLKNTDKYPFNSSSATVQLGTVRNKNDYTVDTEIVSYSGGFVNGISISDKLLNGFKIAFSGSATNVVVNCYVRGGI